MYKVNSRVFFFFQFGNRWKWMAFSSLFFVYFFYFKSFFITYILNLHIFFDFFSFHFDFFPSSIQSFCFILFQAFRFQFRSPKLKFLLFVVHTLQVVFSFTLLFQFSEHPDVSRARVLVPSGFGFGSKKVLT